MVGLTGKVGYGSAWWGLARYGRANGSGRVRRGGARPGVARLGLVWQSKAIKKGAPCYGAPFYLVLCKYLHNTHSPLKHGFGNVPFASFTLAEAKDM